MTPRRDANATRRELEVIDRLDKLRVILPAMALETATARRETVRLRAENARLTRRLAEIEPPADASR
ncbi:hypothetical protein [Conexibacter woesei]|uniref:hypothetical protein n=1 Tax=Conexibacter woesei TaxID=191495 RepID=UPI0004023C00|nr:hypothetical protein [Conexibacter woesei]